MAIETLTVADLRSKTTDSTSDIYYTTDLGFEGEWHYVGTDSSTNDNTGTVITAPWTWGPPAPPSGSRLVVKRIYDKGFVNIKWFGAKGDGSNDDTDEINAALCFASDTNYNTIVTHSTGGCIVFFPKGIYKISDTLIVGADCKLLGVSKGAHPDFEPNYITPGNPNLTMFGLKNSYGRLTFNNESVTNLSYDINLDAPYFLVQANLDFLITVSPLSLIDIKFVNISINGGALSSVQTGIQTLGVDCVQIASTRNGGGWQDAQIIRNNF